MVLELSFASWDYDLMKAPLKTGESILKALILTFLKLSCGRKRENTFTPNRNSKVCNSPGGLTTDANAASSANYAFKNSMSLSFLCPHMFSLSIRRIRHSWAFLSSHPDSSAINQCTLIRIRELKDQPSFRGVQAIGKKW
jgi:hypothetical protein